MRKIISTKETETRMPERQAVCRFCCCNKTCSELKPEFAASLVQQTTSLNQGCDHQAFLMIFHGPQAGLGSFTRPMATSAQCSVAYTSCSAF